MPLKRICRSEAGFMFFFCEMLVFHKCSFCTTPAGFFIASVHKKKQSFRLNSPSRRHSTVDLWVGNRCTLSISIWAKVGKVLPPCRTSTFLPFADWCRRSQACGKTLAEYLCVCVCVCIQGSLLLCHHVNIGRKWSRSEWIDSGLGSHASYQQVIGC